MAASSRPSPRCADIIARAIDVIADRLERGGRLVYQGAGTSGRLGVLDATECPPTFSAVPGQVIGVIAGGPEALTQAIEGAEDRPELGEQDLKAINLRAADVVVGIATSGRTPYVCGGLDYARRVGAFTIGLSCNPESDLIPLAHLAITPVVGPEVLTGSTRLKAGTATKLVLNMLSTGAMVRLGKTYGNLMVDLKATNSKLQARANRIVRTVTGLGQAEADDLLRICGGELKTTLVAWLAGISPEEARERLKVANGRVRQALAAVASGEDTGPAGLDDSQGDLPSRTFVLGIDGGGTHTVALLADGAEGNLSDGSTVLGRGEAGPSNLKTVGAERALRELDEAISHAFTAAGLERQPVAAACLGLAGLGRAEDRLLVQRWGVEIQLAQRLEVVTDAELLLAAGTPEGWGLAVVCGTGSIAIGRGPDGRQDRAGGWGPLLGDEGSGYALALAGLRAATQAEDGRGPPTILLDLLLGKLNLHEPQQLVTVLYGSGWDRTALAGLAVVVLEAAEGGDAVAVRLAQEGAGAGPGRGDGSAADGPGSRGPADRPGGRRVPGLGELSRALPKGPCVNGGDRFAGNAGLGAGSRRGAPGPGGIGVSRSTGRAAVSYDGDNAPVSEKTPTPHHPHPPEAPPCVGCSRRLPSWDSRC